MARRPMYYVAKEELFRKRWQAWVLNALGAFPVNPIVFWAELEAIKAAAP